MPVIGKIKLSRLNDDWLLAGRLQKVAEGKPGQAADAAKRELKAMDNDPLIKPRGIK